MLLSRKNDIIIEDLFSVVESSATSANLSQRRLSYLGVKSNKEGKASEHIVPFFLETFEIKRTKLTNSISNVIVELDNLALQIDKVIDDSNVKITGTPTFENFKNLENKIIDCFSPLVGQPGLESLIIDTLKSVNISFKFNTTRRHLIYNFNKGVSYSGCTTFYLFPLISYLGLQSPNHFDVKHVFSLISNYIQILDDYIDVFDDINLKIVTPVTKRLQEIENREKIINTGQSSLEILTSDVIFKLRDYLDEIEIEITRIRGNNKNNNVFLNNWHKFHDDFSKVLFPLTHSLIEDLNYLQKIHEITPPFICYVS